ncbi:MAG TPA: DUF2312 domain-containing protein [Aestuariivirgaceae bacterium]|jgi:uncharacterized protein (UPF0335 family)|nr:DUF2312 domain-containing protein [Aestuariivirgaceae bacterium]
MDTKPTFAKAQLKSLVERIEKLEEEKKALAGDIREVYAEAKGHGFDTKILRRVVSIRKKDSHERAEEEAMLDVYLNALGMIPAE